MLKPFSAPRDTLDVVWVAPSLAPPRRGGLEDLLGEMTRRHPRTRVLLVVAGSSPTTPRRPQSSRRHHARRPTEVADRLWVLEDPALTGRTVVEAAWALDFSDPVCWPEPATGIASFLGRIWRTPDSSSVVEVTDSPGNPALGERADLLHDALAAAQTVPASRRATRVAFVSSCARPSGAEVALARLAPNLPDIDATVVLAEEGALESMLGAHGVASVVLPLSDRSRPLRRDAVVPGAALVRAAWDAARYSIRLARWLRANDTELVATNNLKAALYGGVAGRLAGIPVVWHVRDRISDDYLPGPAKLLVRIAAQVLPTGVIANSEATLSTLSLPAGSAQRLLAVAVGDPCPFEPGTDTQPPPRRPFTIGLVGRIAPWKGQDLFLRAFARAFGADASRPQDPGGVRARIIGAALFGEEEYESQVVALVDALGLTGRVTFTGHVDDVRAELEQLDVVVHASVLPEPFGQVVVEAMALGRPVVAADAGGPSEFVTDRVDGLLYPPGDEVALAERLRALVDDEDLRRRVAAAAPIAVERFGPAEVGRAVASSYRQTLALRARRSPRARRAARSR